MSRLNVPGDIRRLGEAGTYVIWSDQQVERNDRWLESFANGWIDRVSSRYASNLPPREASKFLLALRNGLGAREQAVLLDALLRDPWPQPIAVVGAMAPRHAGMAFSLHVGEKMTEVFLPSCVVIPRVPHPALHDHV